MATNDKAGMTINEGIAGGRFFFRSCLPRYLYLMKVFAIDIHMERDAGQTEIDLMVFHSLPAPSWAYHQFLIFFLQCLLAKW